MIRKKILYVDDEPINLQLFEINFSKKYTVCTAIDGFSGLKMLDENPDILAVISDMKMPGMNGIEFIEKSNEKYPEKKYFILTGYEITEVISGAIETGLIIKCFSKPFNLEEIERELKEAIGDD